MKRVRVVHGDITRLECDAIVNAANSSLLGGGGVDGAIHRAAGKELLDECITLGGCETGQSKITKGYNLPAKFVIHTVGPVYNGGTKGEPEFLYNCYYNSLKLASENSAKTIAFPCISTGVYGYPFEEACKIALSAISGFLGEDGEGKGTFLSILLVCFSLSDFKRYTKIFNAEVKKRDNVD